MIIILLPQQVLVIIVDLVDFGPNTKFFRYILNIQSPNFRNFFLECVNLGIFVSLHNYLQIAWTDTVFINGQLTIVSGSSFCYY